MPTATTYYKKHKISKGETIAQSLKERFDYGQNPDKTEGGELISSYGCDHMTADAEFLLSKAKYKAATGREQRRDADVLCYQIRQSFKPGEITPEEANRIGYETAMRWTKGKYAFFVATHTDKAHIHNHIYYNSTSLDCTRKFRDFIGSGRAVRRLSDRICLENDLSVITNPKLHSKGRFLHYGAWLGTARQPSYKEQLRLAINEALAKRPADFDAFLRLMEASGFTVKHGRGGTISFLVPGQERATRLRASTLGDGYDPEDIKAVIAGERPLPEQPVPAPAAPRRVNLIVDISESDWIDLLGILLDNALEASSGGDTVYLQAEDEVNALLLLVSNPCPPISRTEMTEMFRRGWSTKADQGRGYGLSNVRKMVEQHGGKIIVKNEEKNGQNYLTIGALIS